MFKRLTDVEKKQAVRVIMYNGHTDLVKAAVEWANWRLGQHDIDNLNPEEDKLLKIIIALSQGAFELKAFDS